MLPGDLQVVSVIAAEVHAAYPEDDAVFAERLRLHPAGCLVLDLDGRAAGYVLSHPWIDNEPPELNSLIEAIPDEPSTYYIHDVALLPAARGSGAASRLAEHLTDLARATKLANMSLVAVNNSTVFWERHGFRVVEDPRLARKLSSYDGAARFMTKRLT
jgi:ribosomal protein S18 acetylase RimI-like enzyme